MLLLLRVIGLVLLKVLDAMFMLRRGSARHPGRIQKSCWTEDVGAFFDDSSPAAVLQCRRSFESPVTRSFRGLQCSALTDALGVAKKSE